MVDTATFVHAKFWGVGCLYRFIGLAPDESPAEVRKSLGSSYSQAMVRW